MCGYDYNNCQIHNNCMIETFAFQQKNQGRRCLFTKQQQLLLLTVKIITVMKS